MLGRIKKALKWLLLESHYRWQRRGYPKQGLTIAELPPQTWGLTWSPQGHLQVQNVALQSLAEAYGTPLQIIDQGRLHANYQGFLDSFRKHYNHVSIAYSYKTNPLPAALMMLHQWGADAEVISAYELWLALRLKVPPERIIFNGPAKTQAALETAVGAKIKLINIDNAAEIEMIEQLAAKADRLQPVGIRVVTSVGWSSQFGFRLQDRSAYKAFEKIAKSSHLEPCGIHLHLGTGIKDIATYVQAIKEVLLFARQLKRRLGIKITHFDLGGGFGVPTTASHTDIERRYLAAGRQPPRVVPQTCPSPGDYAPAIIALFRDFGHLADDGETQIIFEPGRAITSSAQSLLLSVVGTKRGIDVDALAMLDGGRNLAMPTEWEHHAVFAAGHGPLPRRRLTTSLYGPLCHPHDLITKYIQLPPLAVGDLLLMMDTGAYFIPNQMNFSYPRPAAAAVYQGRHRLVRRRESFDDLISQDPVDQPAALEANDSQRQSDLVDP
jgi:diaminopimelate decarboxylase